MNTASACTTGSFLIEAAIEPPRGGVVRDKLVEAGLGYRNFAVLQGSDLPRVLVDASDKWPKWLAGATRHDEDPETMIADQRLKTA
jgi:hypothetical protein